MSRMQIQSAAWSDARVNLWTGAVRSGKTIASLTAWLMFVAQAPYGGQLVVVGRTRQSIARNVFAPLQDPTIFGDFADLVHYTPGSDSATILGRKVWVIGASDVRAEAVLRGLTCAGAYVDELTLVAEAFWKQLLARCSVSGARIFATTNPDGPSHWVKRTVIDRAAELAYRVWHFSLDDNPRQDPAYRSSIEAEMVGVWRRRYIEGLWTVAEGAIYDMWDPARHVVSEMPPVAEWLADGVDHGTTNPTRAVRIGITAEPTPRLVAAAEWTPPTKLTDAEQSRRYREWSAGCDSEGLGPVSWTIVDPAAASFRVQLRADGVLVASAANEVIPGIRTVASLLAAGRLVVHEGCRELVDHMPTYEWDPAASLKGQDAPIKTDDHEVDALRYATHTTVNLWRDRVHLAAPIPDPEDIAA